MEMERYYGKAKAEQKQRIEGCDLRPRPGEGIRASQPFCGLGFGDAFQLPKEDLEGSMRLLLSTRDVCSSKDLRQSCSRPSRQYCQGPSGAVCGYVLYCTMR